LEELDEDQNAEKLEEAIKQTDKKAKEKVEEVKKIP
jgi:hypothetical protein